MDNFPIYDQLNIDDIPDETVLNQETWKSVCQKISSIDSPDILEIIYLIIVYDVIKNNTKLPKNLSRPYSAFSSGEKGIIIPTNNFPLRLKKKLFKFLNHLSA
jgi:hypothetical protein